MPNGAGAIVGDEQATVFGDGDAYGAAPDLAVFRDETGEEVFVTAVGVAVVHGDVNDFVAGAVGAVPRAVFRGESVAVILTGELAGRWVESHLKRGHVGLDENIGSNNLGGEIDAIAGLGLIRGERGRLWIGAGAVGTGLREARILMTAHVVPRPAVEAAFLDRSDVVGDQVIAEVVALVGRAPKLSGGGVDGLTDAVADPGSVNLDELACGSVLEDVSPVELLGMRVRIIDI